MPSNECTIPQVLYNTPDPLREPSELYVVQGTVLDGATDPVKRWVVKKQHGYWDKQRKAFINPATTSLPNDPQFCFSLEGVYEEFRKQVMVRVLGGFRYQFEWNPYEPPFFRKFEIRADGTRKPY